jgi:hypothetical protein
MIKRFKHSGTMGDLIYGLSIMRNFGGGEFYLHLNQVDWIGQHYYGSPPSPFHQGRMTPADLASLQPFMQTQSWVTKCVALTPDVEITHNLDKFRPLFVGHPGNYVDIYAEAFGIHDPDMRTLLRNTPWLERPPEPARADYSYVLNRTQRWISPTRNPVYDQWREEGVDRVTTFVGLESEFEQFVKEYGWRCSYTPTKDVLELASVIAHAEQFIGNQSLALSLAIGMGVPWVCELRRDLPTDRNECYFPNHPQGDYI